MTKTKGQGSIVIASFDGKAKSLLPSLKANEFFAGAKNLVLLSIKGNDYCRGDYLGSIIAQSVEKYEFTTFLIADEIYWHNLKARDNLTPNEEQSLKNTAIELGAQYFEEQLSQFLKPLGINLAQFQLNHLDKTTQEKIDSINNLASKYNFEIVRWGDWVARTPQYIQSNENIFNLYNSEPKLLKSLQDQAENFSRRHFDENDSFLTHELLYMRSYGYLREESFYIIWLSAYLNYNFIVYPGDMPKPFIATKEYFVRHSNNSLPANEIFIHSDKPERLANWLEVNFTRKPTPEEHAKAAKPVKSGPVFFKASPTEPALGLSPDSTNPDHYPNFFGKMSFVDNAPMVAIMAGVTQTVLESELPYAFKEDFINQLVNCLSMDTPLMDFDQDDSIITGIQIC